MNDASEQTVATFQLLQPPASDLLKLPSIGVANAQQASRHLQSIHTILISMPDPDLHLTDHLCIYIQHTLNRVLFLCQKFLIQEKRFDFLVEPWCNILAFLLRQPDGYALLMGRDWRYDQVLLEVLFRAVDGLLVKDVQQDSSKRAAVTKDRMPDEARLAALQCLILALPLHVDAQGIQDIPQRTDSLDSPSDTNVDSEDVPLSDRLIRTDKDKWVLDHLLQPPSQPVIAQMIVVLLDTAKDANLVALRRTSLVGVLKLLKCLDTPERIAAWLPGLSAGLTKAMMERGHKEHHSVLVMALQIWTFMLIRVLKNIGPEKPQLGTDGGNLGESLMKMYKGKTNASTTGQPIASTSASEGYGSVAWKKKLGTGLQVLFKEISTLRTHSHWKVRRQFGEMAFRILDNCQNSITQIGVSESNTSGVPGFLLETLIGCTQDEYRDVADITRHYLGRLMEELHDLDLKNVGKEILRERLVALPRVLHGADEAIKQNRIKTAQGLVLFLGMQMEFIINHQTLLTYLQPWIDVLTIEQLDQYNMDERGGILGDGSNVPQSAYPETDESRWNAWVFSNKGSGRKFGFPRRIHLHLREQQTSIDFTSFLRQIGSTTEINIWTEELTSRLRYDCQSVRENQEWFDATTVSTVLMMNQILLGAFGIGLAAFGETVDRRSKKGSVKRKHQRHVKGAAKAILDEYLAMMTEYSQMSLEAKFKQTMDQQHQSTFTHNADARTRKSILAKMIDMEDDEGFEDEQPSLRIYDYNTDVMLQCLLLEGIASTAVVLGGVEFEMELVRVLYVVLEHLGDQDSVLIRDTAEATLEHVAFVCGYNSIGDLIQANYDYVIQQVSQRIAFLSTNPKTPQVLWALIRVVGPPAISMLEDSVTEIFEALDHWKNQEDEVAEGLLKSLSEIVNVMAKAVKSSSESQSLQADENTDGNSSSISKRDSGVMMRIPGVEPSWVDKPSSEVAEFVRGYRILVSGVSEDSEGEESLKKEMENMTPEQIKDYFLKRAQDAKEDEERLFGEREEDNDDSEKDDDENDDLTSFGELRANMPKPAKDPKKEPPTKHQALCLRILNKAGYFLTATSPRMRILALETIQGSIVVLKDRPLELNPAIHEFWPSIVGRVLRRAEMEVFYVSLRAIEVLTLLAENCSDFLGRHLLNDIWPFILKALRTWTAITTTTWSITATAAATKRNAVHSKNNGKLVQGSKMTGSSRRSQTKGQRSGSSKMFTREHRLQMVTLESVAKIVRKVRMPVQEIWEMLLLVRDMMLDLDGTLDVRNAAAEVIRSMACAGHGDSVFLALDETMQEMEQEYEAQSHAVEAGGNGDEEVEDDELGEAKKMCKDILTFMEKKNL
ncbi:TEL2-interacting protein 1 [Mortierella polycephala]|uniref:TEL2-interacting protein 1 n=1 Tax=Mortierella polycephala TaxID=41804 RepID=A0A9P6Q5I9_9FUNG|nr:TEL2-interacting protein 1 [Mortierella polycephala]